MANTNKTQAGSVNVKEINQAVKTIEMLTNQYKRKRMREEEREGVLTFSVRWFGLGGTG